MSRADPWADARPRRWSTKLAIAAGRSATDVPGRAAPSAWALPKPALRSLSRHGVRSLRETSR